MVDGYAVLQPRVSVTMASAAGSLFARTYAGHTGVDPYTTAVSDVYQDLFGEGIYTGKGLYDVDAFMAALEGRVPENALLSHDLFEGIHARAALVTDVELVDDYPSNVLVHAKRQHRWVRGDWQILWWLFPWVPTRTGFERNRLPLISRWKILDNLRRSLVAPALVALFIAGWTFLPGTPLAWTLMALATIGFPVIARLLQLLGGPQRGQGVRVFLRAAGEDLEADLARITLQLTFLAHQAWDMLHAVGVTLARLLRGQGRLLQWETAAAVAQRHGALTAAEFYDAMRASPLIAGVGLLLVVARRPSALPVALLILALWVAAPLIAFVLSKPVPSLRPQITRRRPRVPADGRREDVALLRHVRHRGAPLPAARQRAVRSRTARRAPHLADQHRDEPAGDAVGARPRLHRHRRRCSTGSKRTLTTIDRLEHFEGHLLNWYDTQHPRAAAAEVRLDRRQRQPRRRAAGAGGRPAVAGEAGGHGRRRRPRGSSRSPPAPSSYFDEMNFSFLYDRRRRLFAIGYRLADSLGGGAARRVVLRPAGVGSAPRQLHRHRQGRRARGALVPPRPPDHQRARLAGAAVVVGHAVRVPDAAAADAQLSRRRCSTPRAGMAVRRQIDYGATRGTPWGISESAYTAVDRHGNYQYKAFGVPGLGLKRGLGDELVIAPYATALAVLIDPAKSARNLRRLADAGLFGDYGFFEAIDYTDRASGAARSQAGQGVVVPAFFAHHAGMSLVALANAITQRPRWSTASTPTRGCRPPSCCCRNAFRASTR